MKSSMGRWLLGFGMLFLFAGVYTPQQAEAQKVVVVVHHRRHHHRTYHHDYHR